MKLTLLRHGETDGSRRDLYYGAADIPALPESLAALHENAAAYPRAPGTTPAACCGRSRPWRRCTATYPMCSCRACGRWTSATLR